MHIGRYEPYQEPQTFPYPRENMQKLSFEKWDKLEQDVCIDMIRHYDNDFQSIAQQMTITLGGKIFRPGLIRKVYYSVLPEQELSKEMVRKIIMIYSLFLLHKKRHVWPFIQQNYISYWHVDELKQKFINFMKDILRNYILIYGKLENQHFFEGRVTRIGLLQYNAIFFFGQYTPNNLEKECELIVDICDACSKLLYLISFYIENGLDQIYDPLDLKQLNKLPTITDDEFEQIMERILLLDTIHRICYGLYPYNSHSGEEIQYNPVIELEYFPIPQRKIIKIGSKFLHQRKKVKKSKNIELQVQMNYYASLTSQQMNCIVSCPAVQLMLIHISFLQRDAKLLYIKYFFQSFQFNYFKQIIQIIL